MTDRAPNEESGAVGEELPTVSVVIPTYNAPDTIERALNSVYAQTYPNIIEVIVVDDGSTDETPEVIREKFPDANLIQQENAGSAVARNRGVAEASGEYIAFLDDDDEWLPEKTAIQMRCFRSHAGLRMTLADAVRTDEGDLFDSEQHVGSVLIEPLLFTHVFPVVDFHYGCSGWVLDCDLFERSGGFLQHMRRSQDTELLWRILLAGYSVARVRHTLFRYYPSIDRKGAADRATTSRKWYECLAPVAKEFANLASDECGILRKADAEARLAAFHRIAAWHLWDVGEHELAQQSLRTALAIAGPQRTASWRWRLAFSTKRELERVRKLVCGQQRFSRQAGWWAYRLGRGALAEGQAMRARRLFARALGFCPLMPGAWLGYLATFAPNRAQRPAVGLYNRLKRLFRPS